MNTLTEYTLTALTSLSANTDKIISSCSKEQILFLLLNSVHLLYQVRYILVSSSQLCSSPLPGQIHSCFFFSTLFISSTRSDTFLFLLLNSVHLLYQVRYILVSSSQLCSSPLPGQIHSCFFFSTLFISSTRSDTFLFLLLNSVHLLYQVRYILVSSSQLCSSPLPGQIHSCFFFSTLFISSTRSDTFLFLLLNSVHLLYQVRYILVSSSQLCSSPLPGQIHSCFFFSTLFISCTRSDTFLFLLLNSVHLLYQVRYILVSSSQLCSSPLPGQIHSCFFFSILFISSTRSDTFLFLLLNSVHLLYQVRYILVSSSQLCSSPLPGQIHSCFFFSILFISCTRSDTFLFLLLNSVHLLYQVRYILVSSSQLCSSPVPGQIHSCFFFSILFISCTRSDTFLFLLLNSVHLLYQVRYILVSSSQLCSSPLPGQIHSCFFFSILFISCTRSDTFLFLQLLILVYLFRPAYSEGL